MDAMSDDAAVVYTIGHSNHPIERFLELLRGAGITAVADVRSIPYSRRWPQFGRPRLERTLTASGIAYVYLGAELGGRPADPALLRDGKPDYERMAAAPAFRGGIDRVIDGARRYRIALMCAEREPLECHRSLLVSRQLRARGLAPLHILADGSIEPDDITEQRGRSAGGSPHQARFARCRIE
jgi:uncharacterized protein (DUF488 family)